MICKSHCLCRFPVRLFRCSWLLVLWRSDPRCHLTQFGVPWMDQLECHRQVTVMHRLISHLSPNDVPRHQDSEEKTFRSMSVHPRQSCDEFSNAISPSLDHWSNHFGNPQLWADYGTDWSNSLYSVGIYSSGSLSFPAE